MSNFLFGSNEVVIYNFFSALLTIDTNINQFIKVYHIFDKLQYYYKEWVCKKKCVMSKFDREITM